MSRLRRRALTPLLPVLALLLAACGGSSSADDAAPSSGPSAGSSDGVFPVTVEHAFGSTTVESEPQRVVSVGVTEQDTILALGVTPVGVTDWYGDQPFATWPWAQDALGDAEPTVLTTADGIDLEAVAALEPDLIIGTNAGLEQDVYDQLSAIAPTVAHSGEHSSYFEPWDVQAVTIGTALGLEVEAVELVADIKADFAAVAAAHPEFAGVPVVFLQNAIYDGSAIAYQEGLGTAFVQDLGFVVPSVIDQFAEEGQAYIPLENLSVLNEADVLVWGTEAPEDRTALEAEPFYRALEPVQSGNLVFTDGVLAGAIYFTSPLSLPYVLENLVPLLETAVAGDPSLAPPV